METKVESRIKSKLREMTYQAPTWAEFNNEHRLLLVEQLAVLLGYEADKEDAVTNSIFGSVVRTMTFKFQHTRIRSNHCFFSSSKQNSGTGYGITDRMTELIPTIRLKTSGLIPNRLLFIISVHNHESRRHHSWTRAA
jgi:hypothetical protein